MPAGSFYTCMYIWKILDHHGDIFTLLNQLFTSYLTDTVNI